MATAANTSPLLPHDSEVSCVYKKSCVLPCSFRSGDNPHIVWSNTLRDILAHSFSNNQNQLNGQDYRGRTSLFEGEIPRGNASLLISQVKVQDEAPGDVSQEQRGEVLFYRFEGIYPKPEVTCTPSTEHHTTVDATESGLYSVVRSVRLSRRPPYEYSCNVSTLHSWMSAFYRENAQITTSENKVTIPCTDSRDPIKSLSWIFNHNETIYNSTGSERFYNENWSSYVDKNSAFTSLILKNLTKAQQGLFSCDLRTDSGTSVRNTLLNLHSESALSAGYIIGAAVVVFFIAVLWKVFCMRKK